LKQQALKRIVAGRDYSVSNEGFFQRKKKYSSNSQILDNGRTGINALSVCNKVALDEKYQHTFLNPG